MLYDIVACPHRPTMDLFGNPAERDEINPFVQLLWERGVIQERETITHLEIPFLDLSAYGGQRRNEGPSRRWPMASN
jgi:hypothetical protein